MVTTFIAELSPYRSRRYRFTHFGELLHIATLHQIQADVAIAPVSFFRSRRRIFGSSPWGYMGCDVVCQICGRF